MPSTSNGTRRPVVAQELDLSGTWELRYFDEIGTLPQSPSDLERHPFQKIPAQVPGNVELDLARGGVISADLFHGMNILELRPLENYQWWYRHSFATPDWSAESETEIVFDGLDCFATIWINGVEIGRSANALIAHRFDITQALKAPGEINHLYVRLASPINAVKDLPIDPESFAAPFRYSSLWARKPAHAYGWDIMPRAVSAGIWRSVRLVEKRATELTDVFIGTQRLETGRAILDCRVAFRTDQPLRDFTLRVTGLCGDSRFEKEVPVIFTHLGFDIAVSDPKLWWPRGLRRRTTLRRYRHAPASRPCDFGTTAGPRYPHDSTRPHRLAHAGATRPLFLHRQRHAHLLPRHQLGARRRLPQPGRRTDPAHSRHGHGTRVQHDPLLGRQRL